MTITHFILGSVRGICILLVLLGQLMTVPHLFAASPQPPDASRRLYDRVMEEFRHKDYDAALAGFRFSNSMGNRHCQRTLNIGWVSASTARADIKTRWGRSTVLSPITRRAKNSPPRLSRSPKFTLSRAIAKKRR